MYGSCASGAAAGCGLAATGFQVGYFVMGAFALLAAGVALLRVIPRRQG